MCTAGVYLFIYFLNFLYLKYQNINFFITLFCKAFKGETWYTHGQIVDLLCIPTTSSQNILVPLFFFFFLSLQLSKIKNLLLQNCFNIPLTYMWTLLDHLGASRKCSPTPALPGVRQNLPDVKVQKKKNFFFFLKFSRPSFLRICLVITATCCWKAINS